MSIYCPSCGASVDADATSCPNCGEPLEPVQTGTAPASDGATPGKVNCPECGAVNAATSAECAACGAPLRRTAAARTTARNTNMTRLYMIGFVALVAISGLIFILATPEERVGPPQPAQGAAAEGLPEGHPPIDNSAQRKQLEATIATLQAELVANPNNDSVELQLANALYDAERHAEATAHYRSYVSRNPANLDAKTDMATSLATAGNVDTAIVVLNDILRTHPKHQRAAFNMAIMYRQKENRDSVIYWLKTVAAMDSTSSPGRAAVDILKSYESGELK